MYNIFIVCWPFCKCTQIGMNKTIFFFLHCSSALPADGLHHEMCACLFLPGSAAALVRPQPEWQSRCSQTRRGQSEGHAGLRRTKSQWRVEVAASIKASDCSPASQGSSPGLAASPESPAGLPFRSVPWRSHQHPQRPHRPGQEPGHEDQGSSQRRTDGTDRQEEMRHKGPGRRRGPDRYIVLKLRHRQPGEKWGSSVKKKN